MTLFPYDYSVSSQDPNWRSKLYWPASYRETRDGTQEFARRLIKGASQFEDGLQQRAYIASMRVLTFWAIAVVEAAKVIDTMKGERFVSHIPEVQYLAAQTNANPGASHLEKLIRVDPCRRPLARQISWTAEWSPIWRLPQTLAHPDVIAFNRNPGLTFTARASRRKIRYDNVERLYRSALQPSPEHKNGMWNGDGLDQLLAGALQGLGLESATRTRVLDLLLARYRPVLADICHQLEALQKIRSLPGEVWAGTGGYWPSRIVGLEVMRRGGTVRRFDHGGNKALIRQIEQTAFIEAAVSTHFVFASDGCAERWRKEPIADLLPCGTLPRLEALPPVLQEARDPKSTGANGSARSRPRVMYAPGQLKGFWQVLPSKLPNLVYLDWTMRLAELMQRLPVDLVCRPHPGGVFSGKRHPLDSICLVPAALFEELLDDVDVIVLDSPYSRVMCAALESTKPIIYLDPGHDYFCDSVMPLVRERCIIIPLSYDARGLPQVDAEGLADAIGNARAPDGDLAHRFGRLIAQH